MSPRNSDGEVPLLALDGVYVAGQPPVSRWDICCQKGKITSMTESTEPPQENAIRFVTPSLCHPHIHLDKCFLFSHPRYADLEIQEGDFAEAMKLTAQAKSRFEHEDLMERGQVLIEESINFGVTHMRAFVEVDLSVGMKCLNAGLALKEKFRDDICIQICVFAQDAIVSYEDGGSAMKSLLDAAAQRSGVEALGSTPYVEENGNREAQISNMEFTIMTAKKYGLHLDFHIDYNLDRGKPCMVLDALNLLHSMKWPCNLESPDFRTIVFGHCTHLTLLGKSEWLGLKQKIQGLPVAFVGLPTSDIFMMGRPDEESGGGNRVRGTLQVPQMIKEYDLNAALGINNVGNAFTPHGSCDPLSLASFGVGIYQAGTREDADILLQCISRRAQQAIGLTSSPSNNMNLSVGDSANFVIFGRESSHGFPSSSWRARRTTQDLVNDPVPERTTVFRGRIVNYG
ncbi:uncharacterized protein BP5553_02787 [Venustampulla echinocandica]|uniref:Metallo-dependent hydrolase n=1 Tax=Venustampulla echinocandica TaxID=2656787 RepID=A0A370TSD8_9HELO|nr:uncharacterized protein BP5553_02787 [Venustampulla echinocandica]RDL38447.1 hypothetical protein BP5553_02787 [Venustampulla echinocandica]